jgi:putative PIN family toxin of toxin-antitoxin system
MNVLVDTNVLVSAVIRDRLPQRVINEIVSHDDWFWIVSEEIEAEYREVLARPKFKIPDVIQESWWAFVEAATIRVETSIHPAFPRDPKDEPFIAAALASDADYLITGDKDLLDERPLASTQILKPAESALLFAIA